MNTKFLVAFLAAASLSGCVVSTGGTVGDRGDVTFLWAFDGYTCAQVPEVQTIKISIAGESLPNSGEYPCLVQGYPGIVLENFSPKRYDFTIEALGSDRERLFVTSGSFTVDGNVTVDANLHSVSGSNSYAYIGWDFPLDEWGQPQNCAQAGVFEVEMRIDDGYWIPYACSEGNSFWLRTSGLSAGLHSIDLRVIGHDGTVAFSTAGTFTTWVGYTEQYPFTMSWVAGVLNVRAQLWSGPTTTISCTSAGVSKLYVTLQDEWGNWIQDLAGQPCDPQWTYYFRYLAPGTYWVFVSDGITPPYYSSAMLPVTVSRGLNRYVDARVDRVR
jgi:hypothetical protein